MNTLNLSGNFSHLNLGNDINPVFRTTDIISSVCRQFDEKVLIGLFLILTFYVVSNFMLPISKLGLKDMFPKLKPFIDGWFDMLYSLLDTLSLASILLIISFAWFQGLITTGFITWLIVLGSIVLATIYFKIKNRKNGNIRD